MPLSPEQITLLCAAALAGAALQSSSGLGASMLFAPAAFWVLDPATAVGVTTTLGLVVSALIWAEGRVGWLGRLCQAEPVEPRPGAQLPVAAAERRRVLRIALSAAIPTQILVVVALSHLPASAISYAGAGALALAAISQIPPIKIAREPREARAVSASVISACAGATKAAVGVNGPIIAPYLFWLGWPRWQMRATLARFLGAVGVTNLVVLLLAHPEIREPALLAAPVALALPALGGQILGARSAQQVSRRAHRAMVCGVSVAGALAVAASAL